MAAAHDAMEKEVADLIAAAQRGHDGDNPCNPENHRVLTRLVVIVSRNIIDMREDIATLVDRLPSTLVPPVVVESQLPGSWGTLAKWMGPSAVALYTIHVAAKGLGWI